MRERRFAHAFLRVSLRAIGAIVTLMWCGERCLIVTAVSGSGMVVEGAAMTAVR
jgi:hypothetical protein